MEEEKFLDNQARLEACIQKAKRGEELTLAFFGGSITQGSLATTPENTYAYRVLRWWQERFPKAKLHYVNGGIGGTTSHFGVARAVEDLLMYEPDFVVVDFSVNDDENQSEFFSETYEGLLRRILSWPSEPGVVVLNNVFYDTGVNCQEFHNRIADYYGVPHVSIRDGIYQRMKNGEFTREELTPDGLHPNDKGHGLVAEEICGYLETVVEEADRGDSDGAYEPEVDFSAETGCMDGKQIVSAVVQLPPPLTPNFYEHATRLTIRNCRPALSGFRPDPEEKKGHLDCFKNGWTAERAGDRIRFDVEGTCIAIQYRKSIRRPAPVARAIVDGDMATAIILDANFEENWGDCLYLVPVLHHGTPGRHTVEIEIIEAPSAELQEKGRSGFYLLSLITA